MWNGAHKGDRDKAEERYGDGSDGWSARLEGPQEWARSAHHYGRKWGQIRPSTPLLGISLMRPALRALMLPRRGRNRAGHPGRGA